MRPSDALATHREALRQLAGRYNVAHPRVYGSVLTGKDTDTKVTLICWSMPRSRPHCLQSGIGAPCAGIAWCSAFGADPGVFVHQISRTRSWSWPNLMNHPERVEVFREAAAAIERAHEYVERLEGVEAIAAIRMLRYAISRLLTRPRAEFRSMRRNLSLCTLNFPGLKEPHFTVHVSNSEDYSWPV